MGLYLSMDVGTTAVKVGLFRDDFTPLSVVIEEYTLETPDTDIVELDPEIYWTQALSGIRKAFAETGEDPADVISITCTTQGETLIPVGKDGRALSHAIVWLDARAPEEAAFISAKFDAQEIYGKTGIPEMNGYCPVAKLLWVKKHLPEVYEAAEKFLLLEDYLIFRFSGEFATNPAILSSTGWFDITTGEYWKEMLEYCGIDEAKLPPVYPSATAVGKVLPELAAEIGFSPDCAVTTGAMDQVAAAVGCGSTEEGIVTDVTGTCQVIGATGGCERLKELSPVIVYAHAVPGKYFLLMLNQTAGIVLKWYRNTFCQDLVEKFGEGPAFDEMDKLAEAEPPLSRGVALFPHLTGILGRYNDAAARGAFTGFGLDATRGCFIRAILEGVAYMGKESLEVMGVDPKSLIALGGGAKSGLWNQIHADVYGREIRTLTFDEAALLGAAIMGAAACGKIADLTEAKKLIAVKDVFKPQEDAVKAYAAGYEKYLKMYECLAPLTKR